MKRAVLYCRVSTNDPTQKNSLDNQIEHYNELFEKNKNITPVKFGMLFSKERGEQPLEGIFADDGITGTKKKNRKAFEAMMDLAKKREFDVIYVKNIARFSRNVGDGANDLKLLKSYGVDVIFEDGNLSYLKNEGTISILLGIAQEESRGKSIAIQYGIRKAQQQGKWTSNCPYGYDRVNGFLKINETESEIVKQIFSHYVNDRWGHNKILRFLTNNNIPTKKGGMWYQQHIKSIITNPIHKGLQITHKSENQDVNIILIKDIKEEEWITKKIKGIISEELWQQAQDIDSAKTKNYLNNHRSSDVNLFSTVCKCGNCGSILRRKKKKTKVKQVSTHTGGYEWVCQNNDLQGAIKCKYRNSISEEILIEYCRTNIIGYREHKELLGKNLKEYLDIYYNLDISNKLIIVQERINAQKAEFKNIVRQNVREVITDKELDEFNFDYRAEMKVLEEEERKLKDIDNEVEKVKRKFNEFVKYLDKVNIDNLTNGDLKKIFAKIKITTFQNIKFNKEGVPELFLNQDISKLNQFIYLYKNKEQIKSINHEFMFLDKNEMDIKTATFNKEWKLEILKRDEDEIYKEEDERFDYEKEMNEKYGWDNDLEINQLENSYNNSENQDDKDFYKEILYKVQERFNKNK